MKTEKEIRERLKEAKRIIKAWKRIYHKHDTSNLEASIFNLEWVLK